MTDMTIEKFCDLHDACEESQEWLASCNDLREAWDKAPAADLIWGATRPGVLTDRELRLFACWCVRQVWHLLYDDRSKQAVEVAERYAIGEATEDELAAARDAVGAAAWDANSATASVAASVAARDAAWDAARDAAIGAARDAAIGAACDAPKAAAWDEASAAAMGAAWSAVRDAARVVAREKQATWLRENCKPNFEKEGKA